MAPDVSQVATQEKKRKVPMNIGLPWQSWKVILDLADDMGVDDLDPFLADLLVLGIMEYRRQKNIEGVEISGN